MTLREAIEYKPSPYAFFCMGNEPKVVKKIIIIDEIEKEVCFYFGLDAESLHVKDRSKEVLKARQIVCYITTKLTDNTQERIGNYFGQDRTTVINSINRVQDLIDTEPEYKADVEYLLNLFNK